jgi:glycosyltransferase involved in cell wall biosynthesis
VRVLRIYHAGRDPAHRARDRALVRAGAEVTLVVPRRWPGPSAGLTAEPFRVVELDVDRPGDVNRHRWRGDLAEVVAAAAPDVVDVHEEPVSIAARQWLAAAGGRPVVMFSAQNLDKRWPPPFAGYERSALRRVRAMYPCSRQAASVLRGKGFNGEICVLPLGVDAAVFPRGEQRLPADELVLMLVGRWVVEKGVLDALDVLADIRARTPARLVLVGAGPLESKVKRRAGELGLGAHVEWHGWQDAAELAALYRRAHIVLVPSRATGSWVEQFGRVLIEGWASGAVPVAYASGAIEEVLGPAGAVVPEGDAPAMAAAVARLAATPTAWQHRRDSQPAAFADWDDVARAQLALYEVARAGSAAHETGRTAARREFGPPASTSASSRPLALPVLRDSAALHRWLRSPPERPTAPPVSDVISAQATSARAWSELLHAEVAHLLRQAHVRALHIKGPSVAQWLYDDEDERPWGDVDVLVPPAELRRAVDALAAAGMHERFAGVTAGTTEDHAVTVARLAGGGVVAEVDVHERFPGIDAPADEAFEELWRRREPAQLGHRPVWLPDIPTRALLVALNTARSQTPQALRDLAKLVAAADDDDWQDVIALARRLHALPALRAGLELDPAGRAVVDSTPLRHVAVTPEWRLRISGAPRTALRLDELSRLRGPARLAAVARWLVPSPAVLRMRDPRAGGGPTQLAAAYIRRFGDGVRATPPSVAAFVQQRRAHRRDRDAEG